MNVWGKTSKLRIREIRSLQNKRLHYFLNYYVYPFSPYYRKLFDEHGINPKSIKSVNDLPQIPFASKQTLVSNPHYQREFILHPDKDKIRQFWPPGKILQRKWQAHQEGHRGLKESLADEFRPIFLTFTSGMTQDPVSFAYTAYDIESLKENGCRMLRLFNIQKSDYFLNMFPFAPHLAFWQVALGALADKILMLSTGGGKVMGTEGNIASLEKLKPAVIFGVPSYVYHVLRTAKERGCRLPYIRKIVLGAAKVSVPFKKRLMNMLKETGAEETAVLGTYGFTEARTAWGECYSDEETSSGYHLYPDKEIFEVIDPRTGMVLGEGEDGELVYTSLDSRGSAMIRFRTGDYVKGGITYAPCPHCGRTIPRLSSDITRLSDVKDLQLDKIKGTMVNLNNFTLALSAFPEIEEWQVEIRKKDDDEFELDEIHLYLSCKKLVNQPLLAEDVRKKLFLITEVSPNHIAFISFADMIRKLELETAGKEKRIVDKRPKESL